MKKIRVLIVEDSDVVRHLLEHIIGGDPRLEVVGSAGSAEEAWPMLQRVSPDVISLDIRLPGMDGFEATRRIMRDKPTPIVVCSASVESEDLKITMNALRAGALAVVEKPVGVTRDDYERLAGMLCTQLAIMSEVRVIRQRTVPDRPSGDGAAPIAAPAMPMSALPAVRHEIVGVGASTGGPNAVVQLLTALGRDFPLPVLIVQHIIPAFLGGFAAWLDNVAPQRVRIARDGDVPEPGCVYLAPADQHLRLDPKRLRLSQGPPISHQRPSATSMLESIAASAGPAGIGILLTGMGDDGADGLVALRRAGGFTIAEHASTAVVYGMPKAAVDRRGASEVLPLPEIAPRVLELLHAELEA
jgi:two-component system chemotaxis response regulator CheB